METKTRYCEFNSNHTSTRLAVKLMRSTCTRYPTNCDYFKIKALCPSCVEYVETRIKTNGGMHCSVCAVQGRAKDFWTILGDV